MRHPLSRLWERHTWPARWHQQPAGQRWVVWAHTFSKRYAPLLERRGALDLVLARLPLLHSVQDRWLYASQWLSPRLHLALHPLLRQTVWRKQAFLFPGSQTIVTQAIAQQQWTPWRDLGQPGLRLHHAIFNATSLQTIAAALYGRMDAAPSRIVNAFLHRAFLHRTFANAMPPLRAPWHSGIPPRALTREFLPLKTAEQAIETRVRLLVEHLARQSQRVEQRVATPTTTVVLQSPPMATMPTAIMTEQPSSFSNPPAQSWQHNAMSPPGINLEQLTDQIARQLDRRVVAMRERLGRV